MCNVSQAAGAKHPSTPQYTPSTKHPSCPIHGLPYPKFSGAQSARAQFAGAQSAGAPFAGAQFAAKNRSGPNLPRTPPPTPHPTRFRKRLFWIWKVLPKKLRPKMSYLLTDTFRRTSRLDVQMVKMSIYIFLFFKQR